MFNGALTPKQKPPVNKPTPPKSEVHVKTVDSLGGYNDKYLRKENFLGEYLSDSEKAIVRDNLGINVGDLLQYVKDLAGQEITGGSPVVYLSDLMNNSSGIRSLVSTSPTGSVVIINGQDKYLGDVNIKSDEVEVMFTITKEGEMQSCILHLYNDSYKSTNFDFIQYN